MMMMTEVVMIIHDNHDGDDNDGCNDVDDNDDGSGNNDGCDNDDGCDDNDTTRIFLIVPLVDIINTHDYLATPKEVQHLNKKKKMMMILVVLVSR